MMHAALAVVAFLAGLVLELGGVFALASWQAKRTVTTAAKKRWRDNGASDAAEPEDPPGLAAPAALLGVGLVTLASTLLFLFAYHLGAS